MYGTVGTHNKVYAFTPEIGSSFWPSSNQIIPISKSMMYLNLTAAKMTSNFASITDTASTYTGNTSQASATFSVRNLGINGSGDFIVRIDPVSSNITSV